MESWIKHEKRVSLASSKLHSIFASKNSLENLGSVHLNYWSHLIPHVASTLFDGSSHYYVLPCCFNYPHWLDKFYNIPQVVAIPHKFYNRSYGRNSHNQGYIVKFVRLLWVVKTMWKHIIMGRTIEKSWVYIKNY